MNYFKPREVNAERIFGHAAQGVVSCKENVQTALAKLDPSIPEFAFVQRVLRQIERQILPSEEDAKRAYQIVRSLKQKPDSFSNAMHQTSSFFMPAHQTLQ